jgi:hypothetical protein
MGYRDDHQQPPACPTCKQPAVTGDPLFGLLYCPADHEFDWPRWFDGRCLAGDACPCGSTSFAFGFTRKPARWWQRLLELEPEIAIVRHCKACLRHHSPW